MTILTLTTLSQAGATPRQTRWWQEFSEAFSDGRMPEGMSKSFSGMVLVLVIALGVLSGFWLYDRIRNHRLRSLPLMIFHKVAAEMGLGWQDQWLLTRIAQQQGLPTPLTLLLSPATLAHHACAYGQTISAGRRLRVEARTVQISRSLFGAVN